MFANLKNQTTRDTYVDGLAIRLPGTQRVFLQVANAAVLYQEDKSDEGKGLWTDERFLTPTVGSFDRSCSGMRFRSAVAGSPAQVSVELLDADELAGGADSVAPAAFTVDEAGAIGGAGTGVIPVGGFIPFAGQVAPAGEWLLCDGTTLNSVTDATLADLYAAIGTQFGGSGAGDFKLPDLRGRVPVGIGQHADVASVGLDEGVALAARTPRHFHSTLYGANSVGGTVPVPAALDTVITRTYPTSPNVGFPQDAPAHLVVNYIIRAR